MPTFENSRAVGILSLDFPKRDRYWYDRIVQRPLTSQNTRARMTFGLRSIDLVSKPTIATAARSYRPHLCQIAVSDADRLDSGR
jgi:hypothetical protein